MELVIGQSPFPAAWCFPKRVCVQRVLLAEAWPPAPHSWAGEGGPGAGGLAVGRDAGPGVRGAGGPGSVPGSLGFTLLPLATALKSRALEILKCF